MSLTWEYAMPFREKVLWIGLSATLVIWIPYFWMLGKDLAAGAPEPNTIFWRMISAIIVSIVFSVALIAVAATTNPKGASLQPDERESLFEHRANTVGYYVLALCVVMVAIGSFWGWSALVIANAILASLLIADVIRGTVELIALRRG